MAVSVFNYPQVINLTLSNILPNSERTGTYMHVSQHYTNSLIKLFRNTDQRVDLLLKDWDRRPIKFEDYEEVWFKLVEGTQEILELQADLQDFDRGWYSLNFARLQTGNLALGNDYSWCIVCKSNSGNGGDDTVRQLFADLTYGAAAPLQVLEGPLPAQAPALSYDLTTLTPLDTTWTTSALVGGAQLINPNGAHSVTLTLDQFTGTITVEGSLDLEIPTGPNGWFEIDHFDLTTQTGPYLIGFSGNYNWFRVKFTTNTGVGSTMGYRNA